MIRDDDERDGSQGDDQEEPVMGGYVYVDPDTFLLDDQLCYLTRCLERRHKKIFGKYVKGITVRQFGAMVKLLEIGECRQSALGRKTAMDGATIKGVVDRLQALNLVESEINPDHRTCKKVNLVNEGRALVLSSLHTAVRISDETLERLTPDEQQQLLRLLAKTVEGDCEPEPTRRRSHRD